STRHQCLDGLWGGLDKAYIAHKWLGIGSVGLAIAHIIILQASEHASTNGLDGLGAAEAFHIPGIPSLVLFIALALAAIIAKKVKYETWKTIHKFMLLPYIFGLAHYYSASSYNPFELAPFGIWLNIINFIGIISAVYSIFLYERIAFPYKYKVVSVQHIAKKTFEITGQAINKHIVHRAGQFTFLKITKGDAQFSSHPFTISSAPHKDSIQFSIKALGDNTTQLMETVKTGDEFVVTKPHGKFNYTAGSKHQIWIAGGIGITPFRSFCQTDIPKEFSIDFFYAYNGEEGAYINELKAIGKNNLCIHLIDSTKQGYLTVDKIQEKISAENPFDIYFCGPKPMRESLRNNLENSKIRVLGFHFEEFTFGRNEKNKSRRGKKGHNRKLHAHFTKF
ncbi:MAG: ferric reductase-like transmembrane domain-containing protein, partial [Chloroflexi bacterium]|nr:ferric reductase-like transmembrane domain-containing protein [Chloroflexota bacterium]